MIENKKARTNPDPNVFATYILSHLGVVPINKEKIESILKDYHWMINSIKIMRDSAISSNGLVAQSGVEASLPKPKGKTSDPVFGEVVRKSKYHKRIEDYEEKVKIIQDRIHLITDNRETEVLNWMLEGKGYSWIARHMGLSERHIRRIKDSIAEKLSNMPNSPNTSKNKVS